MFLWDYAAYKEQSYRPYPENTAYPLDNYKAMVCKEQQ